METKRIAFMVLAITITLGSCVKKQQALPAKNESGVPAPPKSMKYGVSVVHDRLKFQSIQDYLDAQKLDAAAKNEFINYVEALSGFTSIRETRKQTAKKTTVVCDCSIDDDYVNSVVDQYYMVQIDDWVIKLNGCDRTAYALDVYGMNAADFATATTALQNCDFTSTQLYVYSFDQDVIEEIQIARDSLNGNVNARGLFCGEVAISNRWDEWPIPVAPYGQVGDCKGLVINVPHFTLWYSNNAINGQVVIEIPTGTYNPSNWPWRFDFQTAFYRTRCTTTYNNGPFQPSGSWNGTSYRYVVHSGLRLTNAPTWVSYLIRARIKDNTDCVFSPYIQIVP